MLSLAGCLNKLFLQQLESKGQIIWAVNEQELGDDKIISSKAKEMTIWKALADPGTFGKRCNLWKLIFKRKSRGKVSRKVIKHKAHRCNKEVPFGCDLKEAELKVNAIYKDYYVTKKRAKGRWKSVLLGKWKWQITRSARLLSRVGEVPATKWLLLLQGC